MISFDLTGRRAIVTGASSGLGRQMATALAEQGARVAALARRKEKLESLAAELGEKGCEVLPVSCDVTDEAAIKAAVAEVKEAFGGVDILVNNAGVCEFSAGLTDHTTEQWDRVINTDLKAVFLMTREVAPLMMEQKWGRVVNIASVGGIQASPSQVGYFAAKGGVVNLTKSFAADLAPYNILVNAIGPGVFATEMTDGMLEAEGSLVLKARTALKRFGEEGELNGALIYFCSDACTYTTAQTLFVDGGLTSML